jgi:TolB-like protein/Tfp pilus assembly protein PilF
MPGEGRKRAPGPPAEIVVAQLEKVLGSRTFSRAEGLGRLLRYLVEETVAGRSGGLKEVTVGVEALGRGSSFDPDADPIVRVQARRLRQKLEAYYRGEGLTDAIVIELPKGAYIPTFAERTAGPPSRRRVFAYAASGLATVSAGAWLIRQGTRRAETEGASGKYRSIAVLPFKNLSGDPAQDYFTDGLTEVLITSLSKIGSLRVLSRSSAMTYKNASKKVTQIAREVNVDTVVEGSAIRLGDRVRITVQLIDAARDGQLWAETYERNLSDVLRLQSEVAQRIAAEIRVALTPMESDHLASTRRVDTEALRPYLEARYYASQLGGDAIQKSITLYQQAIERAPEFAPAHSGLAFSHIFLCGRQLAPRQGMPKAKAAALRALQLDEGLAEAQAALGWVSLQYDWDWNTAEWRIGQTIRLNASLPVAHQLRALYFTMRGEHEKAISEALLAQELDPLSHQTQFYVALIYFSARRFEQAAESGRKLLERDPNFPSGHLMTALALAKLGKDREAMDYFRTAARLDERGYLAMSLAHGYSLLGPKEEAYRILDKMVALSKERYICAYEVASAYATLGEKDRAFDWFRKAVQDRSECLVWAKVSPWLDPVRSDPRFETLLRQVGFEG